MKYALLTDDVIDVISLEPQVEPWIEVPEDVFAGFRLVDGQWIAPAVESTQPLLLSLTPKQWEFFLDLTGFRQALDQALEVMPKTTLKERLEWAGLKAIATREDGYRLDITLALVARIRANGLPVTIPGDEEIAAAFQMASTFTGAQTLLAGAS